MDISQSDLAWLYLYAMMLGLLLGAFYDVFRITRVFLGVHYSRRTARNLQDIHLPLLPPHKKKKESRALGLVVFFEDLLFCLMVGISLIVLFYVANNGKFRFPVLICVGAGFLLYRGTLGRLVMLFSEVIAFAIETAVRYALFFLLFPIRALCAFLQKKIKGAVKGTLRRQRKHSRLRYTVDQNSRATRDACGLIPVAVSKKASIKRGKYLGKGNKKAVQSDIADARASGRTRRGVHRRVRQ